MICPPSPSILAAISAVSDVIVQYDTSLRYIYINQVGAQCLGRTAEEVIGKTNADLIGPEGAATIEPYIRSAFRENRPVTVDHHIPLPTGLAIFESTYTRIANEAGSIESVIGICRDVTSVRKELEDNHAKLINSAKLASLGEMAGGIAHEINNPLMTIMGYSELSLRGLESGELGQDKLRVYMNRIDDTTKRIAAIVRSLLTISRDGSRDPMQLVSASEIVEDTLALFQEKIGLRGIDFQFKVSPPGLKLNCRQAEIGQILVNIISNAIYAINELDEKWIRLSVEQTGGNVEFRLTNSGSPIPQDLIHKIFQPFFTTKEVGKGTGLGLSVSQGIARAHGGHLELDLSAPNTCFVLKLPV